MSDQAVVTLKDVDVEFHGKNRSVHAVDHVSLTVNRGDIYGIVGYSGAGKSTLVQFTATANWRQHSCIRTGYACFSTGRIT